VDRDILPSLLGYNIRRAQIALWRDFARTVADGAVRPGMFSAIALIKANPGIAQIELANELGIDKASMVVLVDRTQDAGWVVRTRSQEDRRRQGLSLTPAGAAMYRKLKREMLEHEEKFSVQYSAAERRQLLSLLRRLHEVTAD
jgi:DNA-binding MarR family transcriptional regulator